MATIKVTEDELTSLSQDWGGNGEADPRGRSNPYIPTSDGLGFSGLQIQKYLKNLIDNKAGVFFYDTATNRYMVFSSEENKELYYTDPVTYASLLLGSFDAPFNYTAEIELVDTPTIKYIAYGSTGTYIKANFDILNKQGASIGENVTATVTFRNGSATQKVVRSVAYGTQFALNIDDYLREGTNTITVGIVGQNTLAATTVGLTYYSINLQLSDTLDISQTYNVNGNLNVPFTISGSSIKRLEWFIDNIKLPYEPGMDDVTEVSTSRTKVINLSNLPRSLEMANGRHNLQYRAYIEISDGTKFYSDILYRDFIVNNGWLQDDVIVTAFEFKSSTPVAPFANPIQMYSITQYLAKNVRYAIYTPFGTSQLTISFNGKATTYDVINGEEYVYQIKSFISGTAPLVFTLGETTLTYNCNITASSYTDLHEIATNLALAMSGDDRNNASENRASWSYGTYTGTLTGFDFTERSGWNDGALVIPDGAEFETNFAPLATEAKTNGATFEFEYETRRVLDDDAVICDLRNTQGTGILITASQASISSRGGVSLSTRYKSNNNIRIAFVVNSVSAARNAKLLFIYIDGILAGAAPYNESDSFASNVAMSFAGSEDATIYLKYIRCYNRALSAEEVLNNYNLYRHDTSEIIAIHDRNNILGANGQPDPDKLSAYTPIIIITGDVEKLQNFTRDDKGTYVKMDKIEVINILDSTKNMTLVDPSMRCQGTSSMDYPRKNFRFYTQKDNADTTQETPYVTKMYDYKGNELFGKQRLYAFKDNAQVVKTWCLKADYAESSSTHNTGIARLWNTVMKNAIVEDVDERHWINNVEGFENSKTPCRTLAQHIAINSGYDKDVRTTVDGFPIVLFYHKNESDPLICLGKYNWNNDKSTESVYGFTDIPGFDNTKMECWEVVNGDYDINQFISMVKWDAGKEGDGWQQNFESRYPDDSGEESEAERAQVALKTVCAWVCSTAGAAGYDDDGKLIIANQTKLNEFKTNKWNHFDVYKLAAYYIYLMRFGGVDQTVKNAMFTTEDGQHWYYINYDNDTINGVRNDGLLKFGYNIDRQSKDPDNPLAFCYAGHASTLWNNCEIDEEFMTIVKIVDQALFNAGLTYPSVIDMFNNQQSAKWSERLHNYDYTYKYLDVWNDKGNNQLEKLQGPRRSHREWWLANRFAIYDGKNLTGQYKLSNVNIKPITSSTPATEDDVVKVTPIVNGQVFGWKLGSGESEHSYQGHAGEELTFSLEGITWYIGASIFFYNTVYAKKIDFSAISAKIAEVHLETVNSNVFESNLTDLILGYTTSDVNTTMTGFVGIVNAKYLEKIICCNYKAIQTLDLSNNKYLKELDFRGCTALTTLTLPIAAPLETIKLPSAIQTLKVEDLVYLDTLTIENNGSNINSIEAKNSGIITDSIDWIKTWMTTKTTTKLAETTIRLKGINWNDVDIDDLFAFDNIHKEADGYVHFTGTIVITGFTEGHELEEIIKLRSIFGPHCMESTNELYITANEVHQFFIGPDSVVEGHSGTYSFIVVGKEGTNSFSLAPHTRTGVTIDERTGELYTTLTNESDESIKINVVFTETNTGAKIYDSKTITVTKETYPSPTDITINGNPQLSPTGELQFNAIIDESAEYTGYIIPRWTLEGDAADYFEISSQLSSELRCTLRCIDNTYIYSNGVLKLEFVNRLNPPVVVCTKTLSVAAISENIAVSASTNAPIMTSFWNAYGHKDDFYGTYYDDVDENDDVRGERIGLDNENYITKEQALRFIGSDFNPTKTPAGSIFYSQQSNVTHFDEFKWFNNIEEIWEPIITTTNYIGDYIYPNSVLKVNLISYGGTLPPITRNILKGENITTSTGYYPSSHIAAKKYIFPNLTTFQVRMLYDRKEEATEYYLPKWQNFGSMGEYLFNYEKDTYDFKVTIGSVAIALFSGNYCVDNCVDLIISKYATSVTTPKIGFSYKSCFRSIVVENGNTDFEVVNGWLIDKVKNIAIAHDYTVTSLSNLPNSVTAFGVGAILSLKVLSIPTNITNLSYGNYCLYSNDDYFYIPNSVTTFGGAAVEYTYYQGPISTHGESLNLTIGPKTLTQKYNSDSYNIEYDDSRTVINGYMFCIYSLIRNHDMRHENDTNIVAITIGENISTIKNYSITGMSNCKDIYSYAMVAPTTESRAFSKVYRSDTIIDIGTNTKNLEDREAGNILHLREGATGYDTGAWANLTSDSGGGYFIKYDL